MFVCWDTFLTYDVVHKECQLSTLVLGAMYKALAESHDKSIANTKWCRPLVLCWCVYTRKAVCDLIMGKDGRPDPWMMDQGV